MGELSAIQLIDLWQPGAAQPPHAQLEPVVAAAAGPGVEIGTDTLGRRNQRLLDLHRKLTRRAMEARTRCGACGTDNEFEVPAEAILASPAPSPTATVEIRSHGKRLRCRLPTMADLRVVHGLPREQAQRKLASLCVVAGNAAGLTKSAIARLDAKFEALDPAARIVLDLNCAECGGRLRVLVDVAEIVAVTLDQLVEKAMREVHVLASAYGWSEADILNLPPARRGRYLTLVAASSAAAAPMRAVR